MKRNSMAALAGFMFILAMGAGLARAAAPEGESAVGIPAHFEWVRAELLTIMWLFIAAILLGPIVAFFRVEPPPEPAAHHDEGHGHGDEHGGESAAAATPGSAHH